MIKIPQNIFRMLELRIGVEEAPSLWVVREGAAARVEEPARGALGSLGIAGRSGSCATYILIELLPGHHLNHVRNIGSKFT
jgi:hypothetical protein